MAKHIGIVTMSYEGAALCYQAICADAALLMGEHRHPEITLHSYPLADYLPHLEARDWEAVAERLLLSIGVVARAGADFAICPANTAHEAFAHLTPRAPIPVLHIAEVVAAAAQQRNFVQLGILGTNFLMQGNVYPAVLARRGMTAVIPPPAQRERINALIFDELVKGVREPDTRDFLAGVADSLARQGCDAVVLACTEIPLILGSDDTAVPLLDSTRLLAKAAVAEALSPR